LQVRDGDCRFHPLYRSHKGDAQIITKVRPGKGDGLAGNSNAEELLEQLVFNLKIGAVILPATLSGPGPGRPDGFVSLHYPAKLSCGLGVVWVPIGVACVHQYPKPAADFLPTGTG
jgi:hypothetical protein